MYKTLILKFDSQEQAKQILYTVEPEVKTIDLVETSPDEFDAQGNLIQHRVVEEQEIVVTPERLTPKYINIMELGIINEPTGETHMVTLAPGYEVEAPVFRDLPGWHVELLLPISEKTPELDAYVISDSTPFHLRGTQ